MGKISSFSGSQIGLLATWPIQICWPIWPMTHRPLTHRHLWSLYLTAGPGQVPRPRIWEWPKFCGHLVERVPVLLCCWHDSITRRLDAVVRPTPQHRRSARVGSLHSTTPPRRYYDSEASFELECGPVPNVMATLPNIGGALCSTPQPLADAHYWNASNLVLSVTQSVSRNYCLFVLCGSWEHFMKLSM